MAEKQRERGVPTFVPDSEAAFERIQLSTPSGESRDAQTPPRAAWTTLFLVLTTVYCDYVTSSLRTPALPFVPY